MGTRPGCREAPKGSGLALRLFGYVGYRIVCVQVVGVLVVAYRNGTEFQKIRAKISMGLQSISNGDQDTKKVPFQRLAGPGEPPKP
jgi:hypothetical protein